MRSLLSCHILKPSESLKSILITASNTIQKIQNTRKTPNNTKHHPLSKIRETRTCFYVQDKTKTNNNFRIQLLIPQKDHNKFLSIFSLISYYLSITIILFLLIATGSCVTHKNTFGEFHQSITTKENAPITVSFERVDASIANEVFQAVQSITPKVTRWGHILYSVDVRIYPTHEALEKALGSQNISWIRAFATHDTIYLQSPRTWGGEDREERLEELLSHEMTHAIMYQHMMTSKDSDPKKLQIPIWFIEGMASVTSEQGYRRLSVEQIGRYLLLHSNINPLQPSESFYRENREIVYSSAHLSFLYLVESNGEDSIKLLFSKIKMGSSFDTAFFSVFGESPSSFEERLVAIFRASTSS